MTFNTLCEQLINEYRVTQPWLPKVTGNNVLTLPKQPQTNVGYIANNQNEQVLFPKQLFGKRNKLKTINGTKTKLRPNR